MDAPAEPGLSQDLGAEKHSLVTLSLLVMLLLTAGFPRCCWRGLLKLLFSLPGIELDFQMVGHRCMAIFSIFPHEAHAWQRGCWAQEQWAG